MSLRLKNESTTFPPEGLRFEERQLGWKNWINDPTTVWSWDGLVGAIYNLRQQNRARFPKLTLDRAAIRIQISEQNARRIAGMAGAETYLMPSTAPVGVAQSNPPQAPSGPLPKVAAGHGVDALARGMASMLDWWVREQGKPVAKELAEKRASICLECPKHAKEGFASFFTKPAQAFIQKKMEARLDLKLETSHDADLYICTACTCPLKLAVHQPVEIKVKHLSDEQKADLWSACWIREEAKI